MPCYRCGAQGYENHPAGYCLNTITPHNEVRITSEAGPGSGGLEAWTPNHLLDDINFDVDEGGHGYEAETYALAGKSICQQCEDYLQDFGVLLPDNHAKIRHWSPPQAAYAFEYDYYEGMDEDPRLDDIVDPGCMCPQCYPHPERTTLIDFYRGDNG
jgi:hypothetical protein